MQTNATTSGALKFQMHQLCDDTRTHDYYHGYAGPDVECLTEMFYSVRSNYRTKLYVLITWRNVIVWEEEVETSPVLFTW